MYALASSIHINEKTIKKTDTAHAISATIPADLLSRASIL